MRPAPPFCASRIALLDAVNEIRPAGADVGAEHVGAVALVVHAAGERAALVPHAARIAEDVERDAADRRQEHREVRTRDQLRIHAAGLLEQRAAQRVFLHAETFRDAGQIPDRLDRRLGDRDLAGVLHDRAVDFQPSGRNSLIQLRNGQPCLGDRDAWADVGAFGDLLAEILRNAMAPGIERHDAARFRPLRKRPDVDHRRGVGQIRPRDRAERAGGYGKRAIERVGAAVRTDRVAVDARVHRADHRAALARRGRAPADREARGDACAARMRGEADMRAAVLLRHCLNSMRCPKSNKPPARHKCRTRGLSSRREDIGQKGRKIKPLRRQQGRGRACRSRLPSDPACTAPSRSRNRTHPPPGRCRCCRRRRRRPPAAACRPGTPRATP